jgi:hypothetical protein
MIKSSQNLRTECIQRWRQGRRPVRSAEPPYWRYGRNWRDSPPQLRDRQPTQSQFFTSERPKIPVVRTVCQCIVNQAGTGPDYGEDQSIEKPYTEQVNEECRNHPEDEEGSNSMERAMVDGMSVEENGKCSFAQEKFADLVQIRMIAAKYNYPSGVPAGITGREHPGNNLNGNRI